MACNLYKGIDILAPATAPVVSWCGAAYRGGLRALLLCPHSPSAGGPGRALCAARARESGDRGGACGRAAWRLSPAALSVLTQHTFFCDCSVSFENLIISVTQTMLGRSALSVSRVSEVCVCGVWGPVAGSSAASALSRPAGRAAARARERERERERAALPPCALCRSRALSPVSLCCLHPPHPHRICASPAASVLRKKQLF